MNVSPETGSESPESSMMSPSDEARYEAAEREHFGDPDKGTGIYSPTVVLAEDVPRMRKLSRAMMPAWKVRQLKVVQGGLCALCGRPVDLSQPKEGVVDHDHDTGEIRGVLHRSCNSGEGKVANAAGSWIAKSMSYSAIRAALKQLLAYYERPGTGLIYPTFVDAATAKRKSMDKRNLAAKQRRAQQKAARVLRDARSTTT